MTRICIELELEVDFHESDNGQVSVEALRFIGATQNIMQFLQISEQDAAQQALEDEVEKALTDKLDRARERKEMRGDHLREIALDCQREEMASRALQRGVRV